MYPPLTFRTDPTQLKAKEAVACAQAIGLSGAKWKGLSWSLPCFERATAVRELVSEEIMNAPRHYIVYRDGQNEKMRFGTGYIEEIAAHQGLHLTRDTVDEYVRLYMGLTRGQAGRVLPVEQVDQLPLREELTLITRRKIQSLITPMVVEAPNEVVGCFLISDKLFTARAIVDKAGTVGLEPITLIADTLSVLDSLLEE